MRRFRDREAGLLGFFVALDRKKPTKMRKLPFLPRIGVYVDMAGYELTLKKIPVLETFANLLDRGLSLSRMARVAKQQLAEVQFPRLQKLKVVNTSARTISAQTKN